MNRLMLLPALLAAPLALAQDYDLREVRGFLDGIATGITGYEHEALWHPGGDTVCIGLTAIDAANRSESHPRCCAGDRSSPRSRRRCKYSADRAGR